MRPVCAGPWAAFLHPLAAQALLAWGWKGPPSAAPQDRAAAGGGHTARCGAGHQAATSSRSCPGWEALRAASPHGKRAAPPSLASLTQKMLRSVQNASGAFTAPFLLENYWEKNQLSHPSTSPAIQVFLSISFPLYTEIARLILSCEALLCRWQP